LWLKAASFIHKNSHFQNCIVRRLWLSLYRPFALTVETFTRIWREKTEFGSKLAQNIVHFTWKYVLMLPSTVDCHKIALSNCIVSWS
jgi:hypothetical protein